MGTEKEIGLSLATIAIIDDETMNLELLGFIIGQMGHASLPIQDALSARQMLLEHIPDLILLDVQMPTKDGFELCRELKATDALKNIPIIFITGMDRPENKIRGFELGGVDYVTKPFNPHELKARIRTHIALSVAKRKVEEQAQRLTENLALKNKLFSIIGHDLRSPLSAAKLKMDFIIRGIIDPKKPNFVADTVYELSKSMDEALNLLQNLVGWGKAESGQIETIAESLALHDMTAEIFRLLALASAHKNITLVNEIPEDLYAHADMNTIKTVFRNLISNAIKFTPKGGTITVRGTATKKMAMIYITDTGAGLGEKEIEKILNPKERYSQLGTDKEPGTGLGLLLCQSFLAKNGGKLYLESRLGEGSTFSFDLPLRN